ncbi:MAG: tetratricopeptide repeat protein, partial [Pseudomonadota bacterium]
MADSGDTMDKLFGRAVAAQANGDLSVARQLYEALLAHGTHGDASTNLSICLFLLGDPARAEGHARDALAIDPNNGNAHNNLGLALKVQGRVEGAAAAFDASARTHPQPAVPLTNLAVLFQALGRQAEALSAVDRALASDPFYPQAVELGITLRMEFVRWQDLDRLIASAKALVQKGIPFNPYALFTCCLDPAELLRAQAAYARQAMMDARAAAPWQAPPRPRA